jgi:pimeloyl-ACP methyl ester carboxylesterase
MNLTRRTIAWLPFMAGAFALPAQAETQKAAEPAARGYAKGPFGLIHYRDTGKGEPMVLLHQAPMSSQQFNTVYPLFAAKGIRAIGIDMPGFGFSDPNPPSMTPTANDWAKIVPAVLDHLGIKQAHIVGHHTGSTVALAACTLFPERAKSLTMHTALLVSDEERPTHMHKPDAPEPDVYKPDGSHLSGTFMTRTKMYGPGADPKLITRYVVERFMETGVDWHAHDVAYGYDTAASLKKVKTRTMVIENSGDMTAEMTRRVKTIRPDIAYVELQGGSVDIVDQEPQAWVDAIHHFITT